MTRFHATVTLAVCSLAMAGTLLAQEEEKVEIKGLTDNSIAEYDKKTGLTTGTNGVMITYGNAVMTANAVTLDADSGDVVADGAVRIQRDEQLWAGEHILYNFRTRQMQAAEFRTGKPPAFIAGHGLQADLTNGVYTASNAFITTDDIAEPAIKVRAKYIKIIPGKKIEAHHATLYIGDVPVFYFPFYSRNLGPRANNFNFVPGYRSSYGPFLLNSYNWFLNDELDGAFHLDYRERRGVGLGPDLNYHLGRWGDGSFRYYYLYDNDPNASLTNALPNNRQRIYFSYLANPVTNFSVRSLVRYQGDIGVLHDFFESEYRQNPQPNTYVEMNKLWQNFSLDVYAQPRLNDFFETIERLPDVRLTGYRQQVIGTPFFYESESSAGYYRRLFAETNGPPTFLNYAAARADTYHQLLLPETFFGWLNVTPRVGGRLTYYSQSTGPGATTDDLYRGVFNTGAEVSFKASRLWPGIQNKLLDMDGLRHIVEPSVNYVYVPAPNYAGTNQIPQFDYELPSLRLLPIEFPDYNAIDSIDSQNVLRLGLHNKLQTKRHGEVVNLVNWDLYTDWRLRPRSDQSTFADLYSDLTLKPRSWITLESITRYDVSEGQFRLAFHTLTLQPNDVWSWTIGHFYLKDDLSASPLALGQGNNLFTSTIFYRVNENWGLRASQRFEARDGRMEEQSYTIYRDLRSWTAALTFRVRESQTGPQDLSVAFTFSLKAFPRFGLGSDIVRPYLLLGN